MATCFVLFCFFSPLSSWASVWIHSAPICTQTHTWSISAEHKVVFFFFSHHTTLEELVGGMLTLHTIPLDQANIAYGEE